MVAIRGFVAAERGASAVEFALMLPLFGILFFGGFAICEGVAISRKVTITTRALADLVSKRTTLSASDMQTILGASTQIVAPFNAAPLSLRISEITTDITGKIGTVTWSAAQNATPYTCNQLFILPTSMIGFISTNFIYSEVSYQYAPAVTAYALPAIPMSDRLYMLPRLSNNVSYPCP
jgi:Flp pilus assembly protein TadG